MSFKLLSTFFYFLPPSPPLPQKQHNWKSSERMGIYGVSGKLGLGFQALVSLSVSICRLLTNILSQGLQQEEEEEEEEDDDEEWRKRERVMRIL